MLSQIPAVILASVLAEQGATRTMSAHRRSCACAGRRSGAAPPSVPPTQATYLDMQDGITDLLPRLQSRLNRELSVCAIRVGKRDQRTAHSSASVQTRTRPSDSCSISSAEKKCVDDFEATTWTSTLAYCSQKRSHSEPSERGKALAE